MAADGVHSVVGIGSSAGGLEALTELVAGLAADTKTAFVIAQHLSPDKVSVIVDLISRQSPIPVTTAVDGQPLKADVIAIAPPSRDIEVTADVIRVFPADERHGPSPSIDRLLESIAIHWGAEGVGVILSGTGSDGSQGLRILRAAEGLAIVQAPESAKFDSMPREALLLGGADLVLPPKEIGERLRDLPATQARLMLGVDPTGTEAPFSDPDALRTAARYLQRVSGVDFSGYKRATFQRQIQRRMAVRQIGAVEDYLPILAADNSEAAALEKDLLVTVTSFFRDPDAFTALGERIATYLTTRDSDVPLRVWVPGCSTGQEVFSIAMLVAEALGNPADLARRLKVFGTDLDEPSLVIARRAWYSSASAERIPPALRERYLRDAPRGVEIIDEVRNCAVFARHNILQDPPFPRLDLVSCRNLLIYLEPAMQNQVLDTLRYALVPGGLLFLGASENLRPGAIGFRETDLAHRIFTRSLEPAPRMPATVAHARPATEQTPARVARRQQPVEEPILSDVILSAVASPCLVMEQDGTLIRVIGDVSEFCRIPEGPTSITAQDFLRPDLQSEARALHLMAHAGSEPISGAWLPLGQSGRVVRLTARRFAIGNRQIALLSFAVAKAPVGQPAGETSPAERSRALDREIIRLQDELRISKESLRTTIADLETANEELMASSEELQASSEELQASYEELETTNEELHATNDQLASTNDQLRARDQLLQDTNTDLEAILTSLSQGIVMVDRDLLVTRFSTMSVRLFALVDTDIGRSILTIPTTIPIPGLNEALVGVLDAQESATLTVSGPTASFLLRILRYKDSADQSHGAILTFSDVTELATLRQLAEAALDDFRHVTDSLEQALWKRDLASGRVVYASARTWDITGLTVQQVLDDPDALDSQIEPAHLDAVRAARAQAHDSWSIEYPIRTNDGEIRWILETGTVQRQPGGGTLIGSLTDISPRHALEESLADVSLTFESVFRSSSMGIALLDDASHVLMANEALCQLTGYEAETITGMPLDAVLRPETELRSTSRPELGPTTPGPTTTMRALRRPDGSLWWASVDIRQLPRNVRKTFAVAIVQDVSELHEKTETLTMQAFADPLTGLPNRAQFSAAVTRELARAERFGEQLAIVWLDLDGFKLANDRYGHPAGDIVLKATAERIKASVRVSDTVARLGGDEFAILMADHGAEGELDPPLERMVRAVRAPITANDAEISVSASVGVAIYPTDASTPEDLTRAADTAMYTAKSQGGDRHCYFRPAMNRDAQQRAHMRESIDQALARDEFVMAYQPILKSGDGRAWGAEALVRWRHDGELVTAADFLPFCEVSGQIRPLGSRIARLLTDDMRSLKTSGFGSTRITLNVSAGQLTDKEVLGAIAAGAWSLSPTGVILEVRESVFMPSNSKALEALAALGRTGTQVAVDNYGSGLSSFRALASLSPRYIKLDSALMAASAQRGDGAIRSAVELAHALQSMVVAVDVQDADQRGRLAKLGVDLVQGWGQAPECSADELIAWLEMNRQEART